MNSQSGAALLEEQLRAVYDLTEAGDYEGALADLEKVRSSSPASIYVLALERQLRTLMEYLDAQELGEARRMELIEPMPGLIECALRDLKKLAQAPDPELSESGAGDGGLEPAAVAEPQGPQHSEQIEDPRGERERKDIESVKLLHFQQASAFVAKGEYERALVEVRRVFEVEPDNAIAQEYVARVEQILAQPRRSTLFYVQPPEESSSARAPGDDGGVENPRAVQSAVSETGRHPRTASQTPDGSSSVHDDQTASKRMQSSRSPRQVPAERMPDRARDEAPVTQSHRLHPIDRPGGSTHGTRRFSKKMIVVTVIMGAVVLAGAVYASLLLNRDRSAGTESRVINAVTPEDLAIGASSTTTLPVEPPETPVQKISGETPAVASQVPGKTSIEPAGGTVPPPAGQHGTGDPVTLHPAKPEPVRIPVQKSVQAAESNDKPAYARTSQSVHVTPPPQLLATSKPESKPAATGVPVTETAPASTPEYVPTQKEPQVVKLERPEIPDFIWMSGVVEKVVIRVLIDVDGKPVDTQILMSSKSALEKPVIKAVMNSKFLPGQSAIGPVKTWLTIPFKIKASN